MHLIRGIHNIKPQHHGCVATIGNFDGVHLGHQQVLKQLIAKGKELNLPTIVITFEPLPPEFFQGNKAPARIFKFTEKLSLLKQLKINRILVIRFNTKFSKVDAEDFVTDVLVKKLGIKALIVGDDFRFGHQRRGDFTLLQNMGEKHGFSVTPTETFLLNNERVGSSRVRKALAAGDLKLAAQLLGRPYSMSGHIVHGKKLGRTLGFPTLNIPLTHHISPVHGIFAVWVHGLDVKPLPGAASIGHRPTVNGTEDWLEVYLLDFNQDIYGKFVRVELVEKLRDELKFDSLDALTDQIAEDVRDTKNILDNYSQN